MKKLIFIMFIAITINAKAQYNDDFNPQKEKTEYSCGQYLFKSGNSILTGVSLYAVGGLSLAYSANNKDFNKQTRFIGYACILSATIFQIRGIVFIKRAGKRKMDEEGILYSFYTKPNEVGVKFNF